MLAVNPHIFIETMLPFGSSVHVSPSSSVYAAPSPFFSIYDAKKAGFEKVVFIIKKENETDFKEAVGKRMEEVMEVSYVFQDLHNLPEGYEVPEGRVKPWGTAHAVFSCIDEIDGPFAVINADDYYGRDAFQKIYDYLSTHEDDDKYYFFKSRFFCIID